MRGTWHRRGTIVCAALALSALIAGCSAPEVSSDEFSTKSRVEGSYDQLNPLMGDKVQWQIESFVAKAPPHAVEHRLLLRAYSNEPFYSLVDVHEQMRYREAADDTATPLKIIPIAHDACGFGQGGCEKHQTLAVPLDDAMLRARVLTGYRVKITPTEGDDKILTLSPDMIRRQLVDVDNLIQGAAPETAPGGPRLGIGGIAATATPFEAEPRGVIILATAPRSPAAASGIEPGDILLAIDAQPVRVTGDIQRIVAGLAAGKPVTLQLKRRGTPYSTTVQL